MTGFGNSKGHFQGKEIVIEIRCVNSKVNDFRLKIPNSYRQHELDLRKILNDKVIRGKMDLNICLLYTSDAADERSSVDLGGRRIIKKKKQ